MDPKVEALLESIDKAIIQADKCLDDAFNSDGDKDKLYKLFSALRCIAVRSLEMERLLSL